MAEPYRAHVLESNGKISNTILFGDSETAGSGFRLLPDDSIRDIKMKILYELHKTLHIRAAYEELYLYAFVSEETSTLKLFDALKSTTGDGNDPTIPLSTISQMLEGHPKSAKILRKLRETGKDTISYSALESLLSEKKLDIFVRTPIGMQFGKGRRDATFEADPFLVRTETEHEDLLYSENTLLLNYGEIQDRTLYICLADRVFGASPERGTRLGEATFSGVIPIESRKQNENASSNVEYISRYYYPGLYNASVKSAEDLLSRRPKLVKATADLLSDARETHYKSVQTFYEIAYDSEPSVDYKSRGIISATLRFKSESSRSTNLEMLFKNLHARKETPYIKFNPGNRRENLFRFYFVRTTRTGKKIPYLPRAKIMRLSKETGFSQQMSVYLESVVLRESDSVANCYLHFESNGDIKIQLSFSRPVVERTIDEIIGRAVSPLLKQIGQDLRQTGYTIPMPKERAFQEAKIVDMEYVAVAEAKKPMSWATVPCIYSICTLHDNQARLKRVENFQDMDAARILILELYGKVQYGDYDLHDIVQELVSRKLVDSKDAAGNLVAEVLGAANEMNGVVLEQPGFPMSMKIDKEDHTIELRVSGLTAAGYLETAEIYLDAILKTTQLYKEKTPLLKKLNRFCKKSKKFEEVADVIKKVENVVSGPLRFTKRMDEQDLFAQFASDDDEEEETVRPASAPKIVESGEEEDVDIRYLLDRLHKNVPGPVDFEEEESPAKKEPRGPIAFDDEEDEGEHREEPIQKVPPAKEPTKKSIFNTLSSLISSPAEEPKESLKQNVAVSLPTANEPEPEPKKKGPIDFDDEEDEEEYGGGSEEEDGEDEDRLVPDGMALKPVNPFLKKLRRKDPVLFAQKATGKFKAFSVSCQPTNRHPVILTQDEFEKLDPASYKHSIKYGSDPKNQHHFICPRFWCFLTNSAISEEDVKAGKCGEVMPKGAEKIPKGAYVYELNSREHYPGFIEDSREDGKCLPCCFKSWDGKTQKDARQRCHAQMNVAENDEPVAKEAPKKSTKKIAQKTAQYIYNLDTYPVPHQRWGFLPIPVQLFLNMDYKQEIDPNNPALIQPGKQVLLRYGVEQPPKQSFLGNFANIYANRQGLEKVPSVDEFRQILSERITLDVFAKAHNGSLLSAFSKRNKSKTSSANRKKYENTEFALGLNLTDRAQKRYFDDAIVSYENFVEYLKDKDGVVDHQYLWDLVCDNNARIIPGGLNLVILEIRSNDMLDRVELLCPTNLYSANQFNSEKDTVILLKHGQFYEPIFQYESTQTSPIVKPFFESGKVSPSIVHVLKNVELSTQKYCPALPSLPTVYGFSNPVSMKRLLESLAKTESVIEAQVLNYQGKVIGVIVVEKGIKTRKTGIYVPCAPSARLPETQIKYMDDLSILKDYETTSKGLIRISSSARIPCKPVWKIKEDGLIVGFLTETNQFVPIKPNEDIIMDGLHAYEGVDAFLADKTVATNKRADKKREKMTKYITLESQFYHAFRNRARTLLNQFANGTVKRKLKTLTEDPTILYSQKVERVEAILKPMLNGQVVFVDIDKDVLLDLAKISDCDDAADESPSCIIKENGVAQLAIPKWHLLSKYDNERIYFGRLADELVRNDRVKAFMYDVATRLNAQNVDYSISPDEFVLVQSALTPEYFAELDAAGEHQTKYATQTNYELANPSISKFYPNEKIPLEEQYQEPRENEEDVGNCVIKVGPIIGNPKTLWKRIFSVDAREWTYRSEAECTYQPIIRIAESHLGEKWDETTVRLKLSNAYSKMFERRPEFIVKVGGVMRKQGKSKMFFNKNMTPSEFAGIIASESYYLSDMDVWMLASEYELPIILFNTNGLKGFFAKLDVLWLRLCGPKPAETRFHFLRSTIGSISNKIYEYGLIVPPVPLESTKEFAKMASESENSVNTTTVVEALSKIVFIAK